MSQKVPLTHQEEDLKVSGKQYLVFTQGEVPEKERCVLFSVSPHQTSRYSEIPHATTRRTRFYLWCIQAHWIFIVHVFYPWEQLTSSYLMLNLGLNDMLTGEKRKNIYLATIKIKGCREPQLMKTVCMLKIVIFFKKSHICFENLHLVPEFPVWMVLTVASKCQFLSFQPIPIVLELYYFKYYYSLCHKE